MKLDLCNGSRHIHAQLIFVLQLCLLSLPLIVFGERSDTPAGIMIRSNEYVIVSYELPDEPGSLLLGLSPVSTKSSNIRPLIELLSLRNVTANALATDVWISQDFTVLCLLLSRSVGGNVGDYYLYTFKLSADGHNVSRFRGHFVRSMVLSNGVEVVQERYIPISIRRMLVERLDERSPFRQNGFPLRSIRSMRNVRFVQMRRDNVMLTGILNDTLLFRLAFVVDASKETVRVERLEIEGKDGGP